MPLGQGHTHIRLHRSDVKKPGWPAPSLTTILTLGGRSYCIVLDFRWYIVHSAMSSDSVMVNVCYNVAQVRLSHCQVLKVHKLVNYMS